MTIIILIPAVLCIVALFRVSTQKTFMNVYIPLFMLCPIYYFWKVAALPPIDFSEACLLPLGIAMIVKDVRRWRFALMDIWVVLFIFTSYYADSLNNHPTASTFEMFSGVCTALIPYMIGKLLIEPNGMRVAVVKRIVFCLFICCIISVYEYRMGYNPFTLIFARFFPDEHFAWKTQIRWGFGRVSGPFGQSELGGMIFFFGLILTLWLTYTHFWEPRFKHLHFEWLRLKKSTIIGWTIGIVLLMSQARGPWLGTIVAVPISFIGRARRPLRAAILVATFFLVVAPIAYLGLKAYTSGPTQSEAQENAQYRQQLLDNYIPIAKAGGPWGWGQDFPRAMGQGSIDNEYLFVALTQGWVGLLSFCLICAETLYHLFAAAIYNPTKRDRYFAYSLAGIMIGICLTVFTVFLGNQPYELFFLIAGWSQAVRVRRSKAPEFTFEQVYT